MKTGISVEYVGPIPVPLLPIDTIQIINSVLLITLLVGVLLYILYLMFSSEE